MTTSACSLRAKRKASTPADPRPLWVVLRRRKTLGVLFRDLLDDLPGSIGRIVIGHNDPDAWILPVDLPDQGLDVFGFVKGGKGDEDFHPFRC